MSKKNETVVLSLLSAGMVELSDSIQASDEKTFGEILASQCESESAEQMTNNERIVANGLLTRYLIRKHGKADGLKRASDMMQASGIRHDKGKLAQCVLTVWFLEHGIDLFAIGGERVYRNMFTLVTMDKDGNIDYKEERYEEAMADVLAGTAKHENDTGKEVITTVQDLTDGIFTETFGIKQKKTPLVNWSLGKLKGKKKEQVEKGVKAWFNKMLKEGISRDDETYETYNNPTALWIAEAINSLITPIVTPTVNNAESASKAKSKATAALASK